MPPDIEGIDFNDAFHRELLDEVFPRFIADYDYPEQESQPGTFFTRNPQFSWLDARLLFVMLRHVAPARIVEVGSGFSTLLLADVNRRFLGGRTHVTCIEPYPPRFLERPIPGVARMIRDKVQSVPSEVFTTLGRGDILFIDSSHVSKTGSDVNTLYFDVLPLLAPGVLIHAHDVFLPYEYPEEWVVREGRSWNEQYLLRALLMYSTAFRFLFGSWNAFKRFPAEVARALGRTDGRPLQGGSVWIERLG